jgi:hypothetical protein
VLLDKETPLRALRLYFGNELSQLQMTDDYGFAFSESDLDQPLWKFSDGCALQVAFVHTHANDAKAYITQKLKLPWPRTQNNNDAVAAKL